MMLKAGDRVILGQRPASDERRWRDRDLKRWQGIEAVVLVPHGQASTVGTGTMSYLQPLSPRPDGCDLSEFWWPDVDLVLAGPTEEEIAETIAFLTGVRKEES